jgi:hypothetical protein
MPRRQRDVVPSARATLTVDDIIYDPLNHTSKLSDGRSVPHVTTVLGATGVATNFAELAGVSSYVGENIEHARLRGQAVHADCHAYDDGELIMSTVHHAVRPYVEAWAFFRSQMGIEPEARERRLFHPVYFYTGIMDGIFWRGGKQHVLIDIKTGDPEDSACHLQTAAYEAAWRSATGITHAIERWGVHLTPKNRIPYRIKDYSGREDGPRDHGKWLACLCVYNEQRGRRKPAA